MRKKLLKLLGVTVCSVISIASFNIVNAEEETKENIPLLDGYTRYEAEDALITDASLKGKMDDAVADYGNYSGMGFVKHQR